LQFSHVPADGAKSRGEVIHFSERDSPKAKRQSLGGLGVSDGAN
jgi:hypothetical protein